MAYRSDREGVTSALEEQRELLALERQVRARKLRAMLVLLAGVAALLCVMLTIASEPPSGRYECHVVRREYTVYMYPGGTMQRPPDSTTTCEWRAQ